MLKLSQNKRFVTKLTISAPHNIQLSLYQTIYYIQVFLFLFYIPALSIDPSWIPYAFMASTVASIPLVMVVKEEYNRSRIDQNDG